MYVSTKHVRTKEIKARFNESEHEQLSGEVARLKTKHDGLTRASFVRIVQIMYHKLPRELTDSIIEEIIREQQL